MAQYRDSESEKVVEGFAGMSRGVFALLVFLVMGILIGGFVYLNA
tara:strand:+ start:452 stop:586 length:135 start_codon:yes stop_codon:yes gene_type:complete